MAGASVRGDFEKLRALVEGMGKLNTSPFRRETSTLLAEDMLARVQLGFLKSVDPDGNPWAPVKRKGQPLRDTGRLMNSIHRRITTRGFVIETNVEYAAIHQYGGKVKHAARVVAREADSGRFLKRNLKSTRKAEFQLQQSKPATRVGFNRAYESTITRRQFLPDPDSMPRAYLAGFERVIRAQRERYLGR